MQPSLSIPAVEFAERRALLAEHLQAQGLAGAVLFDKYAADMLAGHRRHQLGQRPTARSFACQSRM